MLSRSLERKANVVNALKLAADRGLSYAERFERRTGHMDSLRIELETDKGVTTVEGAIVMDRPRLLAVDGIRCEAKLAGHLLYLTNDRRARSAGLHRLRNRQEPRQYRRAFARPPGETGSPRRAAHRHHLIETDQQVPESVIAQLLENKAVRVVR